MRFRFDAMNRVISHKNADLNNKKSVNILPKTSQNYLLLCLILAPVLSGCQGLLGSGRDYGNDAMRERNYRDMGMSSKDARKGAFYDSMWDDP